MFSEVGAQESLLAKWENYSVSNSEETGSLFVTTVDDLHPGHCRNRLVSFLPVLPHEFFILTVHTDCCDPLACAQGHRVFAGDSALVEGAQRLFEDHRVFNGVQRGARLNSRHVNVANT